MIEVFQYFVTYSDHFCSAVIISAYTFKNMNKATKMNKKWLHDTISQSQKSKELFLQIFNFCSLCFLDALLSFNATFVQPQVHLTRKFYQNLLVFQSFFLKIFLKFRFALFFELFQKVFVYLRVP